MPWSDDIRCLYCDGRLPLYRKITNGQFCSTAHRKAYWQEQERLAVERLHQTHDTLRAFRPHSQQDIEAIIGRPLPAETDNGELENVARESVSPLLAPVLAAAEPRPWWLPLVNMGQLPMGTVFRQPMSTQPRWPKDGIAGLDTQPLDYAKSVRRPFNRYAPFDCGFRFAGAVPPALTAAKAAARSLELIPLDIVLYPVARVLFEFQPEFEIIEIVEEELPPFAGLLRLMQPVLREMSHQIAGALPLAITMRAQLPLDRVVLRVALAPAEPLHAGLRQLPMDQIALVPGTWIDQLRALDLRSELDAPRFTLATPPARPRLRLAAGRRYAVATQESQAVPLASESTALPPAPRSVTLPQRSVKPLRGAATAPQVPPPGEAKEPQTAGLVSLSLTAPETLLSAGMRPAPQTFSDPQMARPEPIRPRAHLEPLSPPPAPEVHTVQPVVAARQLEAEPVSHLKHLAGFWSNAPRDLKILGVAVPLLLALALHPALPKVPVAPPSKAVAIQQDVAKAWNQEMISVKQSVTERAAIALDEDFRAGLDDWVSRGDATTAWSFDATGFVRPGPLALYRPTLGLTDYEMQFLGMIDKKAMSWVVRAADFNNFYVIKLVVLKDGPLPTVGVTRYAVVDGKADSRVDRIAPIDAREDMLYRVRLDVNGDDYTLTIQGQLIDAWSEPRLRRGGIGFFNARGEQSRVRWVQVTHQYDMLGRLCAYLAPYNITPTTSGSWEQ